MIEDDFPFSFSLSLENESQDLVKIKGTRWRKKTSRIILLLVPKFRLSLEKPKVKILSVQDETNITGPLYLLILQRAPPGEQRGPQWSELCGRFLGRNAARDMNEYQDKNSLGLDK
eukprot:TRINITY_DN27518_c0_g1_i1.p2 TRINITY_DN27518_c0_g1~~TRINITY_DN27518_c0_g1_i1.p2  ORF type:complete len:116 (+),score=18.33 TRINITY_DN27518_c0_g1_i1:142-489(+)